jgi:chemotaxis protein MotB
VARKRGGGHGGHGWFVTFADLMALLMSFFVMVAAYSTQDQKKLQLVAGSMRDAFGVRKDSRYAGIVEQDGIPTMTRLKNVREVSPEKASDQTRPSLKEAETEEGIPNATFDRAFGLAAASLRQALQDMPEIAELSRFLIVEETKAGLDLSMVDQDGRAMFPDGSSQPNDRTRHVLERLGPVIRRMPNRVAVAGHTSAAAPGVRRSVSPWDLSAGRATVVREILAASGVPDDRFAVVSGKADTEPLFPDNPSLAANSRVTITLLKEAPPLPLKKTF